MHAQHRVGALAYLTVRGGNGSISTRRIRWPSSNFQIRDCFSNFHFQISQCSARNSLFSVKNKETNSFVRIFVFAGLRRITVLCLLLYKRNVMSIFHAILQFLTQANLYSRCFRCRIMANACTVTIILLWFKSEKEKNRSEIDNDVIRWINQR